MKIGVPKEIKPQENRVGLTPAGVHSLVAAGHEVLVQKSAGAAVGFADDAYTAAGATMVGTAKEAFGAPLVVKVKEPQPDEFGYLVSGQTLFTYLHLAPDPAQAEALLRSNVTGVAYETVTDASGALPLLVPMSEVAGRLAAQVGATALQMPNGGRGVLMGGVPGVEPARVTVLGGGIVGVEAARMCLGMGADVTLLDINLAKLRELDAVFGPRLKTRYSEPSAISELLAQSDLVVGAVLIPGHSAPKLVRREHLASMANGTVLVDVAIDQGGCFETSRPTTHAEPTYVVDGVVHYCVANMPSACARTATLALTNATLPYVHLLAEYGLAEACQRDAGLLNGINVMAGKVTHPEVAESLGLAYANPAELL